jgi:DNA (cytosine-5)-methyltransferase 1
LSVTGVDNRPTSEKVFELNQVGSFRLCDLATESVVGPFELVIGGPPCRPWSVVNLHRRGDAHEDHLLLNRFFEHVEGLRPVAFLMENVPPVGRDPIYRGWRRELEFLGYSVGSEVECYSDYGAPTARRRLITAGFRDSASQTCEAFFKALHARRRAPKTVWEAISWLAEKGLGEFPDHDWAQLKTIAKYKEKYDSGQYGWSRLKKELPAPSFGSVDKTYTLHPTADPDRVLSVREVLSIMGFGTDFRFPEGTGRTKRYRMVANTVSPVFSQCCAEALLEVCGPELGP